MNTRELFPLESEQPEAKDIKNLLLPYLRLWYLFLIGAVLGIGAAYVYLHYYAVPQYSVYGTMLIKDSKSGQSLANTEALNDLNTFKPTKSIDDEIEVLKSKSLMQRVVSELSLVTSYYVEGPVKLKEIYGSTSPIKVLINELKPTAANQAFTVNLKSGNTFELIDNLGTTTLCYFGDQIQKPYGTFTVVANQGSKLNEKKIIIHFDDIAKLTNHYNQLVVIQPVSKSASVLLLTLVDPIPERAKSIIDKLMEVYNAEAIEDKKLTGTNTLRFLDERLKYLTAELTSVEKGVEKYKSVNGLTDISTQATSYTAQATDYNKQLSEWAIQIEVLTSIEHYLSKPTGQYSLVPSTLGIKDETLLGLIGKFNELQLERERLLRTIQPTSPVIENVDGQLANLRYKILENLRNIKNGLQITSNNLRASSGEFQAKIKKVPAMERELLEINRQQSIKNNIYTYLLQKREETALSLAATVSAGRVLDPAMGGDYPISPNGQIVYLMALLLGLGMPFVGIYLRAMLNSRIQTQQDVTSRVAIPIIGEIAHREERETVVVTKSSRSPIAEMFRLVRANLHFSTIGKEHLVLVVTSSMSGEGKTFISINLGASLAITGKRVALLDLDLREPKVAKELELSEQLGITDYLLRPDVTINDILKPSNKVPGLFVASAGPIPPNPTELMMSSKFAHLMHELKESFDYVIIDTPPVGQVSDAFTLTAFVDAVIYVIRYNYTQKAQLEIIRNIVKNSIFNRPLILLNDAKEMNGANYGYGYGYGYNKKIDKKKTTRPASA